MAGNSAPSPENHEKTVRIQRFLVMLILSGLVLALELTDDWNRPLVWAASLIWIIWISLNLLVLASWPSDPCEIQGHDWRETAHPDYFWWRRGWRSYRCARCACITRQNPDRDVKTP